MKFTCDSCGKRFASVDEPLPGRVYKIRCRRCGHLLSVQAPVPWEEPAADLYLDVQVVAADASESRAAVRAALRRESAAAGVPEPKLPADTEEIPIDLALSDEYPLMRKRRVRVTRLGLALSGAGAAALAVLVVLLVRTRPEPRPPPGAAAPASAPTAAPASTPAPAPTVPTPPPAQAVPAAPASAGPAPRVERTEPARSEGAGPAPRTAAAPPAPERPRPPRGAVAFEHEPAPPAPAPDAPATAPGPEKVDADLAATLLAKGDAQVRAVPPDLTELRAVLDGRRAALDACFDGAAGTASGAAWQGRSSRLLVTIDPSGSATARVEDPALEPTPIASCLRRTMARTRFPTFAGEAVELTVPVALP